MITDLTGVANLTEGTYTSGELGLHFYRGSSTRLTTFAGFYYVLSLWFEGSGMPR